MPKTHFGEKAEKVVPSTNEARKTGYPHVENYIRFIAINFHRTNPQLRKDLNVKPKTLTVLAENIGCNLLVIDIEKD